MTAVAPPSPSVQSRQSPSPDQFETVCCYLCGAESFTPFIWGEDDLTGKPGRFTFVTCERCGLRYQNPRLTIDHIKAYYDDEYIAHRKKSDWGVLSGFFAWVMDRHDRQKDALVSRFVSLDATSEGARRRVRGRHVSPKNADAPRGPRDRR
jgi:hypothetical protein